ncbi:MAG: BBE domain-containing protein [Chloroflexi bacterium]|nr:BBE domain-containing protein [Chloroflexota bacterium]
MNGNLAQIASHRSLFSFPVSARCFKVFSLRLVGAARIRSAYPGATWDGLAAIKARYDLSNLFHRHQNIAPANSGRS